MKLRSPLRTKRMVVGETRWRPPPSLWVPLALFVGLVFFADVFQDRYYTPSLLQPLQSQQFHPAPAVDPDARLKGFLVNTGGCRIPAMDPYHKTVAGFVKPMKHPECNGGLPPLVDANLTSIFLLNSSLASYNATDEGLACCYRAFRRREPDELESDSHVVYDDDCVGFNGSVRIREEFVRVECHWNDSLVYTDLFAFVPLKNETQVEGPEVLNVLMVGLDAVSRLNLHRQMPATLKLLRGLGVVELLGYNKVGDNTFPNLIPVLTGYNEDELKDVCWPETTDKFDKCPFIWKAFEEKGYKTAYAEDSAWMGIFNYVKRGFKKQPTDYYWAAFNRHAEDVIGNAGDMNVKRCVGSRRVYSTMLDYIKKFTTTMGSHLQPYFGFFWEVSLSHDYLNAPKMGDNEFAALFDHLDRSGALNRTAVFFVSDHGIRWGDIRSTFQGRLEERLPFLMVLLPKWFRESHSTAFANLQKNARRLTTPFDLHETLKDLLDPHQLTTENLNARSNFSRGHSLFARIPGNRTCDDAGISSHWCTCQQSSPADKDDPVVVACAEFAVDYMNALLEGYADCANLSLNAVLNAQLLTHNETIVDKYKDYEDYMITLETTPGGGVFEVTVRKHLKQSEDVYEITGTISRINLYGSQSKCVSDFHMKLYCYCKYLL